MIAKLKSYIERPFLLMLLALFKIIVWLRIIYILLSPLLLLIRIYDYFSNKKCKSKYDNTKHHYKRMGKNIYVTGPPGVGKSTFSAGLSSLGQYEIKNMIDSDINLAKKILWKIDYVELNAFIETRRELDWRYEQIQTDYIVSDSFKEYRGGMYDDGINRRKYDDLISNYIRAYYRKLDDNFVMANVIYYSRVTDKYAINIEDNNLKIKLQEFYVEHFNILYIDEVTLVENNLDTSEVKQEEGGKEVTLRLIRNMFESTVTTIFMAQVMSRDLLMYRELATDQISVYDFIPINQKRKSYLINVIREKLLKIEKYFYIKLSFDSEMEKYFDNRPNLFKEKEFRIMKEYDRIAAASYIDFSALIKDKRSNQVFDARFTFPLPYCWGVIETYEFRYVIKRIRAIQKSSYYQQKATNELSAEDYMAKVDRILERKKTSEDLKKEAEEERKRYKEERRKENQQMHRENQQAKDYRRQEAKILLEAKNTPALIKEEKENEKE